MIDSLVAEQGEEASFGIVTSTFTTPNQARWIAEMEAYAEACYPNLTWLETLEAQEDAPQSFSQAQTLLNKYGDDINGIFGMTSVATPAAADAVTQAGACGDVSVIGLATPNPMKPFVEAAACSPSCCGTPSTWDTRRSTSCEPSSTASSSQATRWSRPVALATSRSSTAAKCCSAALRLHGREHQRSSTFAWLGLEARDDDARA